MNRIVIKLTEHGEIDSVASDIECRIFVYDPNSQSEPVYEFTEGLGKHTGVQHVRSMIGDNLAATFDSSGPWLNTKAIREVE